MKPLFHRKHKAQQQEDTDKDSQKATKYNGAPL